MYNPVINPSITEAKFTKLFKDMLIDHPAIKISILEGDWVAEYDNIINPNGVLNSIGYKTLGEELTERFRYYEVCDEDATVFSQLIQDVFEEYKHYYIQLGINYYKEYDYATGNRRRTIRRDKSTGNRDSSSANMNNSSDKTYDLPHKEVSDTTAKGYMTDRTDREDNTETASNVQTEGSFDSDIEMIYDNEFLDLKKQYLNQIRNINDEFVNKFDECFLHIFG